jgi:hypothetical protein
MIEKQCKREKWRMIGNGRRKRRLVPMAHLKLEK